MRKITNLLIITLFLNACTSQKYPSKQIFPIQFDTKLTNLELCDLTFPDPETDKDLIKLRNKYKLDELTKDATSNIDKALIILNWVSSRWEHNGIQKPEKNDGLSILDEAEKGKRFRCVEYGIVLSSCLNAIGLPSRVLYLKTKDSEKNIVGAGHVVSEAYMPDLKKWVFLDGQINYIPFFNNKPLNAIEYQKAIYSNLDNIELRSKSGTMSKALAKKRKKWVGKYLFYFSSSFDSSNKREKCNEKSQLMLVPIKEKEPTVFQGKFEIDYCIYTNNLKDFYKKPKIKASAL